MLQSGSRYYSNQIEECGLDQKELLKITDKLLHRKCVTPLPTHTSVTELANQFSDFFITKISRTREGFDLLLHVDVDIPETVEPVAGPAQLSGKIVRVGPHYHQCSQTVCS